MQVTKYRENNAQTFENIPALKVGDKVNVASVEVKETPNYGKMLVLVNSDGSKFRTFSASLMKAFTAEGNIPKQMLAEGQTVEGTIIEKSEITKGGKTTRTRPFLTIE